MLCSVSTHHCNKDNYLSATHSAAVVLRALCVHVCVPVGVLCVFPCSVCTAHCVTVAVCGSLYMLCYQRVCVGAG